MASTKQKKAARQNIKKARAALKPAPNKNMRKSGKTKGKAIATPVRKRTATIKQTIKGAKGGQHLYRFPMPDVAHARNALARIANAKNMTRALKMKVIARALKMTGSNMTAEQWAKAHNI